MSNVHSFVTFLGGRLPLIFFPCQSEVKDDEGQEYNQIDVAPQER